MATMIVSLTRPTTTKPHAPFTTPHTTPTMVATEMTAIPQRAFGEPRGEARATRHR